MPKVSQMETSSESSPNDHSDRIGKLETHFETFVSELKDLASDVRALSKNQNDLTATVERFIATGAAVKGTFNLQTLLPGLIAMGGFAIYMVGVHLNPLSARVTEGLASADQRLTTQRVEFNAFAEHGAPVLDRRLTVLEVYEKLRSNGRLIDERNKGKLNGE